MLRLNSGGISVWPRAEPFTYGVFQVHPHPRLALHNIKKLISYAKSKGKSGFPKLSYSIWKHVACNKLQLNADLAWVLFYTCMTITSNESSKLREIDERIYGSGNPTETERVKCLQSIGLYSFVIFLYIQQINKISLKASAVSTNAEWPGTPSRASELDSNRSTPIRHSRNTDEQFHHQFISEKLSELLTLLVEPDISNSADGEEWISEEAVEALNLIFEGSTDQGRSVYPLSEILSMPAIFQPSGFNTQSHAYRLRDLFPWIRSWLVPNPYTFENCLRSGKRLQWRLPIPPTSSSSSTNLMANQLSSSKQKIATNANTMPKNNTASSRNGNKLVIMSMISHQIIARCSATLDCATLKVYRAYSSYLYLLSPMRSVTLEKCRKLTIVLGPIENTLQLTQCEDCLVVAACRRVVLSSCRRVTLHLACPSQPVLVNSPTSSAGGGGGPTAPSPVPGGSQRAPASSPTASASSVANAASASNDAIILAPFHTTYLKLAEHMQRANLSVKVNLWDRPFVLDPVSSSHATAMTTPSQQHRCWDLMRPCHFYPFNIPLRLPAQSTTTRSSSLLDLSANLVTDLSSASLPASNTGDIGDYAKQANSKLIIPLPKVYLKALHQRAMVYKSWPQQITEISLSAEQRQLFGSLVDQRFRRWLAESGNLRQLQLLEQTTAAAAAASSSHHSNNNNAPAMNGSATSAAEHTAASEYNRSHSLSGYSD